MKDILKNNELIARFNNKNFPSGCISDFPIGQFPDDMNKRYLRYHRDWNQLMPVVGKIAVILDEINKPKLAFEIDNFSIYAKIDQVYWGVIEFINWYNNKPIK